MGSFCGGGFTALAAGCAVSAACSTQIGFVGARLRSRAQLFASLARSGLLAALFEPLLVGHLAPRGEPAHPGAVRAFGEIYGDSQLARGYAQAVHVILVLVGNEDGVEGGRIFARELHASEELATAEACVNQNARFPARDHDAVAFGAGREHGETHHVERIPRKPVQRRDVGLTRTGTGAADGQGRPVAARKKADARGWAPYAGMEEGPAVRRAFARSRRCNPNCAEARESSPAPGGEPPVGSAGSRVRRSKCAGHIQLESSGRGAVSRQPRSVVAGLGPCAKRPWNVVRLVPHAGALCNSQASAA